MEGILHSHKTLSPNDTSAGRRIRKYVSGSRRSQTGMANSVCIRLHVGGGAALGLAQSALKGRLQVVELILGLELLEAHAVLAELELLVERRCHLLLLGGHVQALLLPARSRRSTVGRPRQSVGARHAVCCRPVHDRRQGILARLALRHLRATEHARVVIFCGLKALAADATSVCNETSLTWM